MTDNLFDSRPDPALGALLREHLDAGDPRGFAARVLARLPRKGAATQWEVLAGWSRPGIAAAFLLAAALGYWFVLQQPAPAPAVTAEVQELASPADPETLMAVVLGSAR
jgi:hypothetical protein